MTIKTRPTDGDVEAFLDAVPHARRRDDGRAVVAMMREITGEEPRLWGPTMIGFGARPYTNTSGTNDWFVVGCSPRAAALTIYGVWDAYHPDPRLAALGPHTVGASCLYVKDLAKIDTALLRTLISEAWARQAVEPDAAASGPLDAGSAGPDAASADDAQVERGGAEGAHQA